MMIELTVVASVSATYRGRRRASLPCHGKRVATDTHARHREPGERLKVESQLAHVITGLRCVKSGVVQPRIFQSRTG